VDGSHGQPNQVGNGVLVVDSKRVFVAAAIAAIPSALSLFIYVGPLWLVAGYLLGFCLWGVLIAPLSIVLKRVDFFFVTTVCMFVAFGLGCWYVQANWVPGPGLYGSVGGGKTYVIKGVATEAYYVELLFNTLLACFGLIGGAPLFAFFARSAR
jgi:hypothetical protein